TRIGSPENLAKPLAGTIIAETSQLTMKTTPNAKFRIRVLPGITLACLTIATPLHAESAFERELIQLREQRDRSIAAANEPIQRRYQASLDNLLRRAT